MTVLNTMYNNPVMMLTDKILKIGKDIDYGRLILSRSNIVNHKRLTTYAVDNLKEKVTKHSEILADKLIKQSHYCYVSYMDGYYTLCIHVEYTGTPMYTIQYASYQYALNALERVQNEFSIPVIGMVGIGPESRILSLQMLSNGDIYNQCKRASKYPLPTYKELVDSKAITISTIINGLDKYVLLDKVYPVDIFTDIDGIRKDIDEYSIFKNIRKRKGSTLNIFVTYGEDNRYTKMYQVNCICIDDYIELYQSILDDNNRYGNTNVRIRLHSAICTDIGISDLLESLY